MAKIHSIPYLGFWVALGLALTALLSLQHTYCENHKGPPTKESRAVCDQAISDATKTLGSFTFTFATSLTLVGGMGMLASFVRMLRSTHHTLRNIADPHGSFMDPGVWDTDANASPLVSFQSSPISSPVPGHSPPTISLPPGTNDDTMESGQSRPFSPQRRPVDVGAGFPWLGTMLQLAVEFLILGFITSMIFGTIPAIMGMIELIFKGHKMTYVTAPKPGTGGQRLQDSVQEASETQLDISLTASPGSSSKDVA